MKNLILLPLFIGVFFLAGCAQVSYDMPEQPNEQEENIYPPVAEAPDKESDEQDSAESSDNESPDDDIKNKDENKDENMENKIAVIKTPKGEIRIEFYHSETPLTVKNFISLSQQGFYNNLTFHRVEPGFVVQGGDPKGDGTGGPGYTVPAEINPNLKHAKGAVAMARLPDQINPERASSGSQFYIALAALPALDGSYTVFGQVIQGMEVVEKIQIGDKIESIEIIDKE